jgi:hypothetical protein
MMHIFLDSNLIIGWGVTLARTAATDLFGLVQDTKSQVYIPELVITESSWHEADDIARSIEKTKSEIRELDEHIESLKLPSQESAGALAVRIETILRNVIKERAIQIIPSVIEGLPGFVEAVVRKIDRSANRHADLGLRDSIILCSVTEFMKKSGISEGLFVTSDGQLLKRNVSAILENEGFPGLGICNEEQAKEGLEQHLDKQKKAQRAAWKARILEFLQLHKQAIERVFHEQRIFTPRRLRSPGLLALDNEPTELVGARLDEVLTIAYSWEPADAKQRERRCKVSCTINVIADVEVQARVQKESQEPPKLKVGDAIPSVYLQGLVYEQPAYERKVEPWGYPMLLEATLIWDGSKFTEMRNLTIKEQPSSSFLSALAL